MKRAHVFGSLQLFSAWIVWRLTSTFLLTAYPHVFDVVAYYYLSQSALLTFALISSFGIVDWVGSVRIRVILGCIALIGIFEIWWSSPSGLGFESGQLGRFVLAICVGGLIGRRIDTPEHFWPLIIVATVSDLTSVYASDGFSHGVAEAVMSTPSLVHPLLVYVPSFDEVPMPLLGLADIVFIALMCAAVDRLELSRRRVVIGLVLGMALGLVFMSLLAQPTPMLPFLGVGAGLALGRAIKPKTSELGQALVFLLVLYVIWRLMAGEY